MTSSKWAFVPFAKATHVERLDSHTYKVNLNDAFCIGAVPNGGYTTSCMLAAARVHLLSRSQPDALIAHFEFMHRTSTGPAIVVVEDVKLSRKMSTLHLSLWQDGLLPHAPWITPSVSCRSVLAYTTHSDLRTFTGVSLPTGYFSTPAAALPPIPDFEVLKSKDADDKWERAKVPKSSYSVVRSLHNWCFYTPRQGPLTPGVLDMWIRSAGGERITQGALPYLADSFPFNLHSFLASPEMRALLELPKDSEEEARTKGARAELSQKRAGLWFPTVVMNLEAKKTLPEEGVEWLNVRVTSKQIRDGRFDIEVMVRDLEGEMVMLSNQVAMIVEFGRNTAKRSPSAKAVL
ncbi:thioesterase family protein [Hypomontagnella monticulosa]|nr:thioesterase family protein [Hypomontagnella monticulosa]